MSTINVTIWNEFIHEKIDENVRALYPAGIHQFIANFLSTDSELAVRTATLEQPDHGLSEDVLMNTDVLVWWGHKAHERVADSVVDRVQHHVLAGMGLIALHSAHFSKIFRKLMGTTCSLRWREIAEKERLWNLEPNHRITEGIGDYIELPNAEMYGERFDIPTPDRLIFISWFEGGEVFRSGCCWERGHGKIFYFRPGHETYPIFHHKDIQRVLINAVHWAQSSQRYFATCPNVPPIEPVAKKEIDYSQFNLRKK